MEKLELLQAIFDQKRIAILNALLNNPERQFYLKELSDEAKVPIATTLRILHKLTDLKLVTEVKISKFKIYQIARNDRTIFLRSFIKEEVKALPVFVESVRKVAGVRAVILHGEERADKASILVLGEGVDTAEVKAVVADIQAKYKLVISFLVLTRDQFEQMREMGLYSGQKRILYES